MSITDQATIQKILQLWQHRVPTKTIAKALRISYPTVSMYIRSFKAQYKQLDHAEVVTNVLALSCLPTNTNHTGQSEDKLND